MPISSGDDFPRIRRLPAYVFGIVNDLKQRARAEGDDIIDFGMGNPDGATPRHIVDKLREASLDKRNHRYSASKGIYKLRSAMTDWYKRRYDVDLDPNKEAIVTIGSKEGLAHLLWAIVGPGDVVLGPTPTYPIHTYGVVLADANFIGIPMHPTGDFFEDLRLTYERTWPRAKVLVMNFPHNPTTRVVDLAFFERIVQFAEAHDLLVIHDLAYADIVFDGYVAPSILQVKGARERCVEFFTLSKSYNMPGWRVGFCCGAPKVIHALTRIKSYLDYGMFQPLQIASIVALNGPQQCVEDIRSEYEARRDVLCKGLTRIGWAIEPPKATMFVWAPIPEPFKKLGSLEFCKLLIKESKVAVSPGVGFGDLGDDHVRFGLIENKHRTRQAINGIRALLSAGAGEYGGTNGNEPAEPAPRKPRAKKSTRAATRTTS